MGNKDKGFTTYTFMGNGARQCFTVYHPLSRKGESLPVIMNAMCYAGNTLNNFQALTSEYNKAAAKYGFARIWLSSPTKDWSVPVPKDWPGTLKNNKTEMCTQNKKNIRDSQITYLP